MNIQDFLEEQTKKRIEATEAEIKRRTHEAHKKGYSDALAMTIAQGVSDETYKKIRAMQEVHERTAYSKLKFKAQYN